MSAVNDICNYDDCWLADMSCGCLQQSELESEAAGGTGVLATISNSQASGGASGPKRLHVSNIPFRFREADLRNLLGVRTAAS